MSPKAILIYPYDDDMECVRVVLVHNNEEQTRLAAALTEFERLDRVYIRADSDDPDHEFAVNLLENKGGLESWLEEQGFLMADSQRVILDNGSSPIDFKNISAAPETAAERDRLKVVNAMLLEALESLADLCEERGLYPLNVDDARATIRAARGERKTEHGDEPPHDPD